ncbi:MAG: hypothetical protein HRT44_01255 [Bdellovibrionales bacterium]|nr:hypothetical protein [Bdellovibrionales bacterium]
MYKASHRPQPYSKVEIELYLDDKRFNFIKKIDPYQVKDFIRKTYLGEKITRNQMSLSEHDEMLEANINSETDLMMKEFIHTYVIPKLSKQIYSHLRVVITYKNWTLLSYESHKTPDIQKVLFDENFVK